ncbi:MAG TPA: amidohydrolase family protein [Longimicrobiaceae bacterium]|nr:amidohydrolase family protein [Longimicrobiaceae bacterium]
MTPIRAATLLAVALAAATGASAQRYDALDPDVRGFVSVSEPVVALTNVRVVDGTGAAPRTGQTIVIENGRIAAVGPAASVRVPQGARVLDLSGHTVIPGMVGLHDHTFYTTPRRRVQANFTAPRLYLASGVTTIRTTGSASPYDELNLKRAIDDGEVPGPHMFITGPYITGEDAGGQMYAAASPEDARRVVAYWVDEGVHWFKFYTSISRDAMRAAIEEAHRRGAKFTGHLCSVGFREAVELGIDNLEHGFLTNSEYTPGKKPDECPANMFQGLMAVNVEGPEVRATFREMVERGVGMTATPAVYELFVANRPPLDPRLAVAMSPEAHAEYLASREMAASGQGLPLELFTKALAYDRAFVRAGGLLAAGVDPTGSGGALPGFGDQRNYELLLEAGFTPAEAVQVMTLNGAKILGIDGETGSIAPGKSADLVVIEGDPAARPLDIRNARIVFKDGVGYDSAKLIDAVKGQVGIR